MRYAAFLRAINVGKHNRITMAELRAICGDAGLGAVTTYLQTGNLLFETDLGPEEAARTIEAALVERGLRNAPAVVRSLDDLEMVIAGEPFAAYPPETHTRYVTLFRGPLPAGLEVAAAAQAHVVAAREREILSVAPVDREPGFDLNKWLSKQVSLEGTTRYFHVVEEVARLLRG